MLLDFSHYWDCRDTHMLHGAGPLPTVSDCFRLFPTVSVSLERQLDLWTTDSTKITTFSTFPDDPSACRLLEMMHFDFETQYTLKIPKPQDLVKFNNQYTMVYGQYTMVYGQYTTVYRSIPK